MKRALQCTDPGGFKNGFDMVPKNTGTFGGGFKKRALPDPATKSCL